MVLKLAEYFTAGAKEVSSDCYDPVDDLIRKLLQEIQLPIHFLFWSTISSKPEEVWFQYSSIHGKVQFHKTYVSVSLKSYFLIDVFLEISCIFSGHPLMSAHRRGCFSCGLKNFQNTKLGLLRFYSCWEENVQLVVVGKYLACTL